MFTDEKAIGILGRLLDKTRAGQVHWNAGDEDSPPTEFEEITSFYLQLPHSLLTIRFESPDLEVDHLVVEFKNKERIRVKRMEIGEGDPDWPLAIALYEEARRITIGWDKVLDELDEAARSPGKIGLPAD